MVFYVYVEKGVIMSAKLTIEQFIERSNKIHNNFYDYSKVDYKKIKTPVTITCPVHGDFDQTPDSHLRHGCAKCAGKLKKTNIINGTVEFMELILLK